MLTVHIFAMYIEHIHAKYIVHIHAKYMFHTKFIFIPSILYNVHIQSKYIFHTKYICIPSKSLYQVYLHAKYIFIPSTSSCHIHCTYSYQVHLHTKYIFIPSTSSCQVHLYANYIFISSTHSHQVHHLAMYIFIPSTPSYQVYCIIIFMPKTHSHQVHHLAMYIFIPSTPSYQVYCIYSCQVHLCAMYIAHIHTKYKFKPSTHLQHKWLASLPTRPRLRWLRVPAMSDKGTAPPCKIDSFKPCPTLALQPLFVPTGWLHFYSWIPSPYLFPPWLALWGDTKEFTCISLGDTWKYM